MTGLYEGFGIIGILVILLTLYTPFITIVLLNKTGLFNSRKETLNILKYIVVYFLLAILTLIILRDGQGAINWLFLYTAIVTIITIVNRFLK